MQAVFNIRSISLFSFTQFNTKCFLSVVVSNLIYIFLLLMHYYQQVTRLFFSVPTYIYTLSKTINVNLWIFLYWIYFKFKVCFTESHVNVNGNILFNTGCATPNVRIYLLMKFYDIIQNKILFSKTEVYINIRKYSMYAAIWNKDAVPIALFNSLSLLFIS